tara:strand:- start:35 stop:778 length:744 start_codon:yes stop_codon:yes gene_type:complete
MSETDIPGERWKTIPQYPEYEISDHGRVKYPIRRKRETRYKITSGGEVNEYRTFSFMGPDKTLHSKALQLLVAAAFVENDDVVNKTCVAHIDNNKHNNHYKNLKWCTRSQNTQDAHDSGVIRIKRPIFKLSVNNIIEKKYESIADAARDNPDIPKTSINRVLRDGGSSKGTYWCYAEDYDPLKTTWLKKDSRVKQIQQVDPATGSVIKTYESATDAANAMKNITPSSLQCAARRNSITAGYRWKYVE